MSQPQPLTILSDDEAMFRDAVAGFANEEVRPRVQQMERDGKIDPALITKFFEMGLMGIEVAEEYGGAGGSLFMVAIGVEEISKVDAAAAILMDVQNTLVNYPIRTLRQRLPQVDVPAAADERDGRRLRAVRSRRPAPTRSACRRAPRSRATRWMLNGRKLWITNGAEARDLRRLRERESVGGLQGHHGVRRRARLQGLQRRQEGRQARHPRVEHDRAHSRRRRSAGRERARPSRAGLQDRDRDAERRTHRHRRADDRRRRRRARTPRPTT